ncbi:hypothetical protein [Geothrix sp. 21YS21S-4]|uniref:RCC1 domain-containing protein n=1 Tax=Geothrix sp. 21YS21S-4 TaxID=3068889 RepID=UPI0027BA9E44|nr:hypothetical protein [Geothrix sp. 21YS21S-4]
MKSLFALRKDARFLAFGLAFGLLSCGGGGGTGPTPILDPAISNFSAAKPLITKGTSTTLTASFSQGTGSITPGVGPVSSGSAVGIHPTADTTYTLTVTNSASKTVTATCLVSVVDPPIEPTVTAPALVAANGTGYAASIPAQANCIYAWTIAGGTITAGAATPSITFSAGAGSNVQLSCVVTNQAGTESSPGKAICAIVAEPSAPLLAAPTHVTLNQTGYTASIPPQANSTYAWTIAGGTIITGATSPSITFTAGNNGSLQLTCTVTNLAGSATSAATCLVVPPPTTPSIAAPSFVTANQSGYAASTSAQAGCTYAWSITGGTLTSASTAPSVIFTPGNTGMLQLSCVVINQAGTRSASGTTICTTVPEPVAPAMTAPAYVTAGQTGYAASISPQNGCTYAWTISGGTLTSDPSASTITFTGGTAQSLQLSCTATNQAGTSNRTNRVCTIVIPPSIDTFAASASLITAGRGTILSSVFQDGIGNIDQGVGNAISGGTLNVAPGSDTTYTLTVTNAAGTSVQRSLSVGVVPAPTITSFAPSSRWLVNRRQTAVLTAVFSHGTGTVDQGIGSVSSGVASPAVGPLTSPVTYTLTVTNSAGDSISKTTRIYGPSPVVAGSMSDFTLSLKEDGTVWAWGYNRAGQLGDGSVVDRSLPTPVVNLTGVVALGVGQAHGLALKADGTVWSWGINSNGQLGNGTTVDSAEPVHVYGLTDVVAIAGGGFHSLALKSDGTVWAWGSNSYGQLADTPSSQQRNNPIPVMGLTDVVAIAGGGFHSLALKSDGTVWAWGANSQGQLGDGTTIDRSIPVKVGNLSGGSVLAAGSTHSLALTSDGTLWGWGSNGNGELGDGTWLNHTVPVPMHSISDVVAMSAGPSYSIALTSDGTPWTWGNNWYGQLGDGTATPRNAPQRVTGLTDAMAVASGQNYCIAVKTDRTLWGWGWDAYGQTGQGATVESLTPQQVNLTDVTKVVAGAYQATAWKTDGSVWTWGYSGIGALGDGNASGRSQSLPNLASFLVGITDRGDGELHSLALQPNGTVWTWGMNDMGQLGDGTTITRPTPLPVTGLTDVVQVAGCGYHSLARKSDGTVWSWGYNAFGQAGKGSISTLSDPGPINGLTNVILIGGGAYHSFALRSDGTVWMWGANDAGQLGDGTMVDRPTPQQVPGLSGVIAVAGGYYHTLALKSDGTVWGWGLNRYGEVGDGTAIRRLSPVQVSGLSGVVALVGGRQHSLALKADGTVWTWGNNESGQLGDGTATNRLVPVQVVSLAGVSTLSAGLDFTLAVKGDHTLWAWGRDHDGILGNGRPLFILAPRRVAGFEIP